MLLDTITKSLKTFLYTFSAAYTVLNFDQYRFTEAFIIAMAASIFVIIDVTTRNIRKA